MTLTDILFGNWTPPDVPGRLISTDDELIAKRRRREFREHGRTGGAKLSIQKASANADRIKIHVQAHPWCTAYEIAKATGLSKTPVYNHLGRFKEQSKIELGRKKVGSHLIISYRWTDQ